MVGGGGGRPGSHGLAQSNRSLSHRRQYDLGYRSRVLEDICQEPLDASLVILTGPRRAGKTMAMLDAAAQLCQRDDLDACQVIHVPCDEMQARDLRRVLTLARALTRSLDLEQPQPSVWLFDEVSGIAGWTSAFKAARDGSAFGDDTVVATGSPSLRSRSRTEGKRATLRGERSNCAVSSSLSSSSAPTNATSPP